MLALGTNVGVVYARDYYVPEDGVTDCSDALQTALNTGMHVALTTGITYRVSKPLVTVANQIIYGNGATLKRINQLATTTTTAITSGVTTTITVASATGFLVGQVIVIENGGVYDTTYRRITTINGNQITVASAFGMSASGTTNVYLAGETLQALFEGNRIFDLTFDGNKSNWTFARWQVVSELMYDGNRMVIQGCKFVNVPGEAMQSQGSTENVTIRDCVVEECNGNGIHFAGDTHIVVDSCRFVNCNLDANVGHSDGCIAWSNSVSHATISNCYMEAGKSGIGSIDYNGNADVTILGCVIKDCATFAIDAVCDSDVGVNNVVVAGNRISNCGPVRFSSLLASGSAADWPRRIQFKDNILEDTRVLFYRTFDVSISGNTIDCAPDTTNPIIDIQDGNQMEIVGNDVIGGSIGIKFDAGTTQMEDILVSQNRLIDQVTVGVDMRSAVASKNNIKITENIISNSSASGAGYDGIIARDRHFVQGNHINIVKGHAGIYPQAGCVVQGNYVRSTGATNSILIDAAVAAFVEYNYVQPGITDNSGGAATVTNQRTVT